MSADQYRIVFDGELEPGVSQDAVKSNLARLFKSDASKVERLFGYGPVNIKHDLNEHEAERYLQALQRAGALARKEPEARKDMALSLVDDSSISPNQTKETDKIDCPKCGHAQTPAIQCERCGIVIEKYLARQAQQASASRQCESHSARPYAPPLAPVGEPTTEHSELKVLTIQGRIGRLRYLGWSMSVMAVAVGLLVIASIASAISVVLGSFLMGIIGLGFLLVSIQIGAQRLHDMGWSAWFMLLYLIPVVGTILLLAMLLVPGEAGMNRFGPPQPPNSRAVKILAALWLLVPVISLLTANTLQSHQ
jgi:uncharacterized membrane protein YhaH (DUF805 family)/DNA-directed RNA polymerase subunit RPC12/RpoP